MKNPPSSKSDRISHAPLDDLSPCPAFNNSSVSKSSACSAGDPGSVPGLGRSPEEGNGNPLQYAYLENPMDRGAWQITVHGVAGVEHDFATKTTLLSTIAPIE